MRRRDQVEFRLTADDLNAWLSRAASFFGPSIDFSKVTVKASNMVFGPAGTAWTCNNVIRFKRATRPQDLPAEATLIHELGHVWEHQTGQAQVLKGIVEQIAARLGDDPYDFGGPSGVHTVGALTDFSKESQAQIIMELWKSEHGYEHDSKNVAFSTPGYVEDLRRLVVGAGIGTKSASRRTVAGTIDTGVARVVNGLVDLLS
jgi:hypothetical protein